MKFPEWFDCMTQSESCVENDLNLSQRLILHHDNAPANKVHSVKQFLVQKSITELEHPPYSPDLAQNDF
jgi:hypothetical protein